MNDPQSKHKGRTRKTPEQWRIHIKDNSIKNESGCWIWKRAITSRGYASAWHGDCSILVHRMSYEVFTGKTLGKLLGCHRCDVPACVNPDHVFAGTNRDNTIDAYTKGRNGKIKGELKSAVIAEIKTGKSSAAIGRLLGLSASTVCSFKQRTSI